MTHGPEPASFLPLPNLPLHILLALAPGDDAHGYAIIKRIGEMPAGGAEPSSGSLYLAMVRLEDRGLIETVETEDEAADKRRRYYRLTGLGRRVLAAETERLAGLVEIARGHAILGRGDSP